MTGSFLNAAIAITINYIVQVARLKILLYNYVTSQPRLPQLSKYYSKQTRQLHFKTKTWLKQTEPVAAIHCPCRTLQWPN